MNNDKIMLVEKSNGQISFPKGGYDKRKDLSGIECAIREWIEEVCTSNFTISYNKNEVIEYNDKGKISVKYYMCKIVEDSNTLKHYRSIDEEIKITKWYTIKEIERLENSKFLERRKKIAIDRFYLDESELTEEIKVSEKPENLISLNRKEDNLNRKEDNLNSKRDNLKRKEDNLNSKRDNLNRKEDRNIITEKEQIKIGKAMSSFLRHNLDDFKSCNKSNGYVLIKELITLLNRQKYNVDEDKIIQVVENNNKSRYEIDSTKTKIRARQGHSNTSLKDEEIYTKITEPITGCIHATNFKAFKEIKKTGLNRMSRDKIHFSNDPKLLRTNMPLHIEVDMEKAMKAGIEFELASNGVILSSGIDGVIPYEFLIVHQTK